MVYALDISDPEQNPIAKFANLGVILNLIIPIVTFGAGIVFIIMAFFGAYTMITAGGDAEKVKKAQRTLTFAIIGLIVVIAAFAIVKLIGVVFNIKTL